MATPLHSPSPSAARQAPIATSRRARSDQVLVMVLLLAIWQGLSLAFGTYWIGSPWGVATRLGREAGWTPDLAQMRARVLGTGFGAVLTQARQRLDAAEARRNELQKCDTPGADPGCRVTVRYISQVLRADPPELVFAQMLAGFELATADPRIAGLNLVQPEDDPVALRDFSLQLSMLDFLPRPKGQHGQSALPLS